MRIGIIGLPQCGKTTVFNALTGAHGDVSGFHAGGATDVAVLKVPEERLDFLGRMYAASKVVQATIEFEDITGIFAHIGMHGEDEAQAVAAARETDALLLVLRAFQDPTVFHVLEGVDPLRDLACAEQEMLLADLTVVEGRIERLRKNLARCPAAQRDNLQDQIDLLDKCRGAIEEEEGVRSLQLTGLQERQLRSYAFLTFRPIVHVLNIDEGQVADPPGLASLPGPAVPICGRFEMEIMELESADRDLFLHDAGLGELGAGSIVRACYDALHVRTFLTGSEQEVRAWTIRAGDDAATAAGKVHTDMEHGFIRAEVVAVADLMQYGSMREVRAHGKVRLEGRDYEVQDGDVIDFRFSS